MSAAHRLVCPFDPSLLLRLRGETVALRLEGPHELAAVRDFVARPDAPAVHAVWLETSSTLDAVPTEILTCGLPLALSVQGFGDYRGVRSRLAHLRRPGTTRVYMPFAEAQTAAGFRILASLHVPTAVVLPQGGPFDWEALSDLATYALLGLAPHAPIEPFSSIARAYEPTTRQSWAFCYWLDPIRYLHVDRNGKVAVSPEALAAGRFVGDCAGGLRLDAAWAADAGWRAPFVQNGLCASCPGWRICSGWLAGVVAPGPSCSRFMGDLLEVVEQARALGAKGDQATWAL